jgi:hypothetical protein
MKIIWREERNICVQHVQQKSKFFLDSVCVSHVVTCLSKKNISCDPLVSPTKINKKREREHNLETMGAADDGLYRRLWASAPVPIDGAR